MSTRRELLAVEIRRASTAFLRGHDSELEDALRSAAALAEGIGRGLS